ncbi:MAG TPA: flagellar assembly protein FliH [Dyella sp.]|uniref:flagellar assembly protein FliH n=1 Tax=Dyella sp. TaxID=1869338 RepID=UPI002F93FC9B
MKPILARELLQDFLRWEPPHVGDHQPPATPVEDETPPRPTVFELEELERQAREEGFVTGLAEGRAKAAEELREHRGRLEALFESIARPMQMLDDATEQELAQLAMVVARRVLAHELRTTPELIVRAVREAAVSLPAAERELRVRLHPDDVQLLRELDAVETTWQLLPDPALDRGDCVLESGRSRLDARIETRLAAVVDAVLGVDGQDEDASEGGVG